MTQPTTNLAPTRGVVYVATGAGYVREACRSAASVREHHPDLPICLITDEPLAAPHPFTEVRLASGPVERKPIDKLFAYEAPYEHCLFLDTDTWALGDLTPIFELLARFDLAVLQDVNRGWDYSLPGVPETFSELNTGVIAFRKGGPVQAFFREWRENHERRKPISKGAEDQSAFRLTLYYSDLRFAPLPSEYHFLSNYPNSTFWKVRLIHGRGEYPAIARLANAELGRRAYLPHVGVIREFHGRRLWLRTLLRLVRRMVALLLRPPPDVSLANPGQWWRPDPLAKRPGGEKDDHA